MKERKWYAVYTRSRHEKKVADEIDRNGYAVYLPLVKTLRQWSDRKKKVEVPLISSYVFVYASEKERYYILNTTGVSGFVMFEGKAAAIPEKQIQAMKLAIDSNLEIEVSKEVFVAGEQVKVINGLMKGAEGELIRKAHKFKLLIRVNNIGYSLMVEIRASDVSKIQG